ncbi:MAG: hypothetical protein U9P71_02580 [Campylobacterota bacterium]|nr:hypothetical protein [Campylobacterota bacterium]
MKTVILDVQDNKLDFILSMLKNLKEDVIQSYHIETKNNETSDFVRLSNKSLEKAWNNKEDEIYDQFLK